MRLTSAGLTACAGLVPIGPGAMLGFDIRGGEAPGDEFDVRVGCCTADVWSKLPKFCELTIEEDAASAPDLESCCDLSSKAFPVPVAIFEGLGF